MGSDRAHAARPEPSRGGARSGQTQLTRRVADHSKRHKTACRDCTSRPSDRGPSQRQRAHRLGCPGALERRAACSSGSSSSGGAAAAEAAGSEPQAGGRRPSVSATASRFARALGLLPSALHRIHTCLRACSVACPRQPAAQRRTAAPSTRSSSTPSATARSARGCSRSWRRWWSERSSCPRC